MSLTGGDVFAGYTIERLLGAGGMGEVYLARHPRLPRSYALKIMSSALSVDGEFRKRFIREGETAAALSDPHIVGVHDRGEADGRLWIAMDYIDGSDADELLQRYPQGMPVDDVLEIVTAIAAALDHAHQRGLLHRDVKPANILVSHTDSGSRRILLADFGIARHSDDMGLTATNMTIGTVAYSAPEQLLGEPVDGRADQYALAGTAFHLLTGHKPYDDSNPAVVVTKQVNAAPPRLADVRPELAGLDEAIQRALAKDPTARFARCTDFANALRGMPSVPAPITMPALPVATPGDVTQAVKLPAAPRSSSRVVAVLVPLVLALALAGSAAFSVKQYRLAPAPAYVSTKDQWQPYVDAAARYVTTMYSYQPGSEAATVHATVDLATGPLREKLTEGNNVENLIQIFRATNASSEAVVNAAGLESLDGATANVLVAFSVQVADKPRQLNRLQLTVVKENGAHKVSDLKYPDADS
jgi:serine/threonine-protein kinase